MLRLLTLRFSIAVWKRSLVISKKLRVRTWIALAAIHACLAIVSFWAYQAKTLTESAIPPVYHAEVQPIPLPDEKWDRYLRWHPEIVLKSLSACDTAMGTVHIATHFSFEASENRSPVAPTISGWEWNTSRSLQSFHVTIAGTGFVTGPSESWWMLGSDLDARLLSAELARGSRAGLFYAGDGTTLPDTAHALGHEVDPFRLPIKLPDFGRTVVVQAPSFDQPYLFESVERWRIFACGLIATLAALVYLFFAWEKRKREKAEAVLTALQIEKARLEIALLKQQWEKAEREARESGIIVSG